MKKNGSHLICIECSLIYYVKKSRVSKSKFCSHSCKGKYESRRMKGLTPEAFKRDPNGDYTRLGVAKKCGHITRKGRYYCASCRNKKMGMAALSCAECGYSFTTYNSAKDKYKCCSMACRNAQTSKRQKGSKSHLWIDGRTPENRIKRNSAEYRNWRKSVFERDDYTCQGCGTRGGKLCSDHIMEWSLYPSLRFDINNGRTLCWGCHAKTDNFAHKAWSKMRAIMDHNNSYQYGLL